jgi:hypothetical protein
MTLSFFLDLEFEDGEFEEERDEDMEESTEASAFQNSYWKADEAGKMVRQKGAWGIYR